jgi:hypothetical protein
MRQVIEEAWRRVVVSWNRCRAGCRRAEVEITEGEGRFIEDDMP